MTRLLAFLRDQRAIAASEFALILPFLVVLLLGTVEAGNALLMHRKITAATQTGADLAAQATALDDVDIANLFDAMDAILEPFPLGPAGYVIESVVDDGGANVIEWVDVDGAVGGSPGDAVDIPEGLVLPGGSVIVVEVTYDYAPVFADLILDTFTISDVAYLRPRRTVKVVRQ
ncbi:MAG: TadE/TadG family type IV pilus assembly protein [Alphaproteobacteria bacterium]